MEKVSIICCQFGLPVGSVSKFFASFFLRIKAKKLKKRRPTMVPMTIPAIRSGFEAAVLVPLLGFPLFSALAGDVIATMFSCAP